MARFVEVEYMNDFDTKKISNISIQAAMRVRAFPEVSTVVDLLAREIVQNGIQLNVQKNDLDIHTTELLGEKWEHFSTQIMSELHTFGIAVVAITPEHNLPVPKVIPLINANLIFRTDTNATSIVEKNNIHYGINTPINDHMIVVEWKTPNSNGTLNSPVLELADLVNLIEQQTTFYTLAQSIRCRPPLYAEKIDHKRNDDLEEVYRSAVANNAVANDPEQIARETTLEHEQEHRMERIRHERVRNLNAGLRVDHAVTQLAWRNKAYPTDFSDTRSDFVRVPLNHKLVKGQLPEVPDNMLKTREFVWDIISLRLGVPKDLWSPSHASRTGRTELWQIFMRTVKTWRRLISKIIEVCWDVQFGDKAILKDITENKDNNIVKLNVKMPGSIPPEALMDMLKHGLIDKEKTPELLAAFFDVEKDIFIIPNTKKRKNNAPDNTNLAKKRRTTYLENNDNDNK